MQTPLKKCPQCGALAYLQDPKCQNCGRMFQTTNPANVNQTQVFVPQPGPQQPVQPQYPHPGYAYYEPKRPFNWTPISVIIGAIIIISPVLFVGFSCVASEMESRAAMARKPPLSDFLKEARIGSSAENIVDKFGKPDRVTTSNFNEDWSYDLRGGTAIITVNFGVIIHVQSY